MRLFVAIDVPAQIKKELEDLRPEIQRTGARGRWTKSQSIHLTLKFLGETDESRVGEIVRSLEETVRRHQAFAVTVRGVGAFPHLERPRILWAGLSPLERLRELQNDLEDRLEAVGFPRDERTFHPHLTLLRLESRPHRDGFARLVTAHRDTTFGEFAVTEMILFQSLLKPDGAEYNALGRAQLIS